MTTHDHPRAPNVGGEQATKAPSFSLRRSPCGRFLALAGVALTLHSIPADASHYRYGQVSWTRLAGNEVEFRVRTAWRQGSASIPAMQLDLGDGNLSEVPAIGVNTTSIRTFENCSDYHGTTEVFEFVTTHTYATEGPFDVWFAPCCRIGTPQGAVSPELHALVDLRGGNQGSPRCTMPEWIEFPLLPANSIPLTIVEPDGDALSCRMATALESNIPWVAMYPGRPLTVSSGCVLDWDTSTATNGDLWWVMIMIEEDHGGFLSRTPVDFMIQICDGVRPECTGTANPLETVDVGNVGSWSFTGTDADGDDLTVSLVTQAPFVQLFPGAGGSTQSPPFSVQVTAEPHLASAGRLYPVTVRFEDDTGWAETCSFTVDVPGCVPPPPGIVSWWPFDEPGAPAIDVIGGAHGAWGGGFAGPPVPSVNTPVYLGGSYDFTSSGVIVPDNPAHDFGTSTDFTIDAWIRPRGEGPSPAGLLPIVVRELDYQLMLHDVGGGDWRLAFDSGTVNFVFTGTPEVIAGPAGAVPVGPDASWTHVALTVDRTASEGTFFVNGAPLSFDVFDPSTLFNTDYTSARPVQIGFTSLVTHSIVPFVGEIDEVEIFREALAPVDLAPLVTHLTVPFDSIAVGDTAVAYPKCRLSCAIPSVTSYCESDVQVTVPLTICNLSSFDRPFQITVEGLEGAGGTIGVGCNVQGPFPGDVTIASNPAIVTAGTCAQIPILIDRPAALDAAGLTACYSVTIEDLDSGMIDRCTGTLKDVRDICPEPPMVVNAIQVGAVRRLDFSLQNTEPHARPVAYRMRVAGRAGLPDSVAVQLDGQPPGVAVAGSTAVPPGAPALFPVDVSFTRHMAGRPFDLVFETDHLASGVFEPVSAVTIWSFPLPIDVVGSPAPVATNSSPGVLEVTPNPLRAGTVVRFALDRWGPVRLGVYDVSGRRVRSLADQSLPAGGHEVPWGGRDDAGRPVAAGTYFFRLEVGGIVATAKAALVRP